MLRNDLISFGLYIVYFIVAGIIPLLVLKLVFKAPFELTRKILHTVITLSIFPLLHLFRAWHVAVIAAVAFALL
ncbi:MAG: hypothetical protein JXN59_14910, partial [Anaerolineae bacterium]|nr:hypothetical protein [Anaerolineae bacterium]